MALAHERTPIASVDIGPALSLEEIGHAYDGVEAVRDVSLAIGAGEVVINGGRHAHCGVAQFP